MLGEKLVLFRDKQGKVQCLSDVCPHRGAPLHKGWVDTVDGHDCVVRAHPSARSCVIASSGLATSAFGTRRTMIHLAA